MVTEQVEVEQGVVPSLDVPVTSWVRKLFPQDS